MDIKRFEILLKKINMLKQNIDLSGEDISQLEVDLLKNYIKKLYESIGLDEMDLEDFTRGKLKKKKKKKNKVRPEHEEKAELVEKTTKEVESIEAKPEEEVKTEEKPVYDAELLALFEGSSASELSEKLGSAPIKDMKKAMGINDQVFTINELFGGDKTIFWDTMEKLNGCANFEEARDYLLAHIALRFNWVQPDNHKKVKRFVKLVQRRYA